jgi:putative ABC transport system permease protein
MVFVKLAWRNILRNRRRTALTVTAIAFGVAALVFTWALFDGANSQSINNMTGTFTGHVQIHHRGYTDDPSLEKTFADGDVDIGKIKSVPGVVSASPRIETPVLISTDENSRGVLLVGVDPALEPQVTGLQHKIASGTYLDPGRTGGILLGSSLAKTLKVGLGGEVAVLTQGMYGSIGAAKYTVSGIYDTGNEMVDNMQAFIGLADAHTLLSSEGHLTTLAIKLENYQRSDGVVAGLSGFVPDTLEIESWKQLLPDVAQKVSFHEWVAIVIMVILFGIVMIGVMNPILMSALERMREFGVMMAMGTSGRQVFLTILYEGVLLGLLGFGIGLTVAYGLVVHFGASGIDFTGQTDAVKTMAGMSNRLHPYLSTERMLLIATTVLIVTAVASVYPALKIACMVPLNALRGLAGGSYNAVGSVRSANRFLLLALASRNVTRHPLRTLLTGFGITFAMATLVFLGCFVTGYYQQIVENSTGFITGDGQVQHRDFKAELKPSLHLQDSARLLEDLRHNPAIKSVSPRVQTSAMVSSPAKAEPILLLGVYPEQEQQVTFLYRSVKSGSYLHPGQDHEIVIGRKLAERLRVDVGEKIIVMAQDVNGDLTSEAFIVAGLFSTGSHGFDDSMAHISLPALQKMLGLEDHFTSIAFRVQDKDQLGAAIDQVGQQIQNPDIKVYPWQELLPEVVQMNTMFKGSLLLVMTVVFLTIAVVTMNTVLMSVLERTREFGILLAVGMSPGLVVRLVLLESALVSIVGSLVGLGFGSLAAYMHSITGMSMKSHGMTAIPGTTDVVFPQLTLASTIDPAIVLPLIIMLISLYPALRASRLDPVIAIRHV